MSNGQIGVRPHFRRPICASELYKICDLYELSRPMTTLLEPILKQEAHDDAYYVTLPKEERSKWQETKGFVCEIPGNELFADKDDVDLRYIFFMAPSCTVWVMATHEYGEQKSESRYFVDFIEKFTIKQSDKVSREKNALQDRIIGAYKKCKRKGPDAKTVMRPSITYEQFINMGYDRRPEAEEAKTDSSVDEASLLC